jgi:hypothetical protein
MITGTTTIGKLYIPIVLTNKYNESSTFSLFGNLRKHGSQTT